MKIFLKWSAIIALVISQFILFPIATQVEASSGRVILVDSAAALGGDGKNWDTAFNDLQDAIDAANTGDEIWVAKGSYYPKSKKDIAFEIDKDIAIYGGFEVGNTQFSDRDIINNETILSGDALQDDDATNVTANKEDNSKTVVKIGSNATQTTVLDGFTISGGYGGTQYKSGYTLNLNAGGGIFVLDGEPTLSNLTIKNNYAQNGGGFANINTDSNNPKSMLLINSELTNNSAKQGGAIYNYAGTPTFQKLNITYNTATEHGGGIYNYLNESTIIENSTINYNKATKSGGGIYLSLVVTTTISDSEIIGNEASENGGGINSNQKVMIFRTKINDNEATKQGGGMYGRDTIMLDHVEVNNNRAIQEGGGLFYWANATIKNSKINENYSAKDGGGFYSRGIQNVYNSEMINNCADGKGSTVFQYTNKFNVYQSTFVQNPNATDAFYQDTNVTLNVYNSIFVQSIVSLSNSATNFFSSIVAEDYDTANFYDMTGTMDLDTVQTESIFKNINVQDYRIKPDSRAINTGNIDYIAVLLQDADQWKITDFDYDLAGNPRTIGVAIDLGAYEWSYWKVLYDGNGNTSGQIPNDSNQYLLNEDVTIQGSGSLEKTGYSFAGWNTKADGTGIDYAVGTILTMGTQNVVLYAKWAVNTPPSTGGSITPSPVDAGFITPATITIKFDAGDGTLIDALSFPYNVTIYDLPIPTKAGYRFEGWYQDKKFENPWEDGTKLTQNMTLYAKWGEHIKEPELEQPVVPKQPIMTFTDIKGHWAEDIIEKIAALEIIKGYPDERFDPNGFIEREHIALMIQRAIELPAIRERNAFNDVPKKHPNYESIMALANAGIIDGYKGNYNPDAPMTRAELAKVLVLTFDLTPGGSSTFTDVSPNHWSAPYIAALADAGIALGYDGNFLPNEPVTRAQFVVFLYRALKLNL